MKSVIKLLGVFVVMAAVTAPTYAEQRQHTPGVKIEDDIVVCNALRRNKFKEMTAGLESRFNTTLKASYHDIRCEDKDIMGIIIDGAADRYFFSIHLQKYYEKDEGIPYEFSKILMSKINGQTVIRRIEKMITFLKSDEELKHGPSLPKLEKMLKKYRAYLKKYPLPEN